MPLFAVLKSLRALSISPSLLRALSPSLCYPLTRTKSSVMASSNNVTPTNCSWWPISAMDEDGKITDGEESNESTIEHKPYSKDRLVLYHWTQSFSSQKVKKTPQHENGGAPGECTASIQCNAVGQESLVLRFRRVHVHCIGLPVYRVLCELENPTRCYSFSPTRLKVNRISCMHRGVIGL